MNVFVTGATGVLGSPVIKRLSEKGHGVHALSRSSGNRRFIIQQGATPEDVDLYDVDALTRVFEECDTVLHLATKIPPSTRLKKLGIWDENDNIRRHGMASIAQAARAAGTIKSLLYPSISFFYGDGGSDWLDAGNARTEPTSFLKSTLDAEATVMTFADEAADHRGIVLRFGGFYGPASPDSVQNLGLANRGFFMPLARPSTYRSMIWIDDAVQAVVQAVENAPTGIYDVTESNPTTQSQAAAAMAEAVGRRRLHALPRLLLHFVVPAELRSLLNRSQRVSNARFREVTGWAPNVPSQTDGWRLLAGSLG